jgi:hypothetical protein
MLLLLTTTRSQAKAFSDVVVCDLEPQIGSLAFQHTKSRTLRTTGINLPTDVWDLLRLSVRRTMAGGFCICLAAMTGSAAQKRWSLLISRVNRPVLWPMFCTTQTKMEASFHSAGLRNHRDCKIYFVRDSRRSVRLERRP